MPTTTPRTTAPIHQLQHLSGHRNDLIQQADHQREMSASALKSGVTGTADAASHALNALNTMGRIDVYTTALTLLRQGWPPLSVHRHLIRAYRPDTPHTDTGDLPLSALRAGQIAAVTLLRDALLPE